MSIMLSSIERLDHIHTYLSIESMPLSPIIDRLVGVIPDMYRSINSFIKDFKIGKDINTHTNALPLSDKVSKLQFNETKGIMLPCPQGLNTTYYQAFTFLQPITHHLKGLYKDILLPYNSFLATIATTPKSRLDTNDFEKNYDTLKKHREGYISAMASCFGKNEKHADQKYDVLFKNPNEWNECDRLSKECMDNINSIDRDLIENAVKECAQYLDVLYHNLKESKDDKTTPEVAKRLSRGAYEIARELEFLSLAYFRVLTMTENYAAAKEKMLKLV